MKTRKATLSTTVPTRLADTCWCTSSSSRSTTSRKFSFGLSSALKMCLIGSPFASCRQPGVEGVVRDGEEGGSDGEGKGCWEGNVLRIDIYDVQRIASGRRG